MRDFVFLKNAEMRYNANIKNAEMRDFVFLKNAEMR